MDKIIFGLVGQMSSGKDTVANYIVEKYGGISVSFSKPLRDILDRLYMPHTRENMSFLAQSLIDRFGSDILSKTIATEIGRSDKQMFILPNIRRESDYLHLKDKHRFILVGINTDIRTCYERMVERNQNPDDITKTWEQFQEDLKLSTEVEIVGLVQKSSIKLNNNGTFQELYKQVDEMVSSLIK